MAFSITLETNLKPSYDINVTDALGTRTINETPDISDKRITVTTDFYGSDSVTGSIIYEWNAETESGSVSPSSRRQGTIQKFLDNQTVNANYFLVSSILDYLEPMLRDFTNRPTVDQVQEDVELRENLEQFADYFKRKEIFFKLNPVFQGMIDNALNLEAQFNQFRSILNQSQNT
jgi:hypothetical protein